jgi:dGTPase
MGFIDRQQMETFEEQFLAPFAVHASQSKGRHFPEEEADYRTCFQRDRDRILHTTAFRRLEYKTQVFINYEGDYYRTRLTHTLEVTQIGRTIARALGANEDLVETICMAHDLGHPPFGHSGESVLAKLMQNNGGFEHNKQSFRIITELEQRYSEFPGLNLSFEVLEGIIKHETEYDCSDARDFNPELRGSLEAQITNIADELAYTAHDLDDGLRSAMITPEMLNEIELWELLAVSVGWSGNQLDELNRHRLIRRLIGLEVSDMLQATSSRIAESRIKSVDDLQRLSYNVAGFSEEMHRRNRQLKDFLFKNLYRHPRLIRGEQKADRVITDLFNSYLSRPEVLPYHIQIIIPVRGLERTICDYIAGMTDRFAIEEHNRLYNPNVLA